MQKRRLFFRKISRRKNLKKKSFFFRAPFLKNFPNKKLNFLPRSLRLLNYFNSKKRNNFFAKKSKFSPGFTWKKWNLFFYRPKLSKGSVPHRVYRGHFANFYETLRNR